MVRFHIQCIMYTDYVTVWQVCEVWFYIKWNIYITILKKNMHNIHNVFHIRLQSWNIIFATLDFTLYISYKTTFFKKIIVKSFLKGFWPFVHQKKQKYFKIMFILARFPVIIYPHMKCRWNRSMLNLCGIVAAILKMATGRNFSMSAINSGHHYLPTYQILMVSENVEFLPPIFMPCFGRYVENFDTVELLL